MNNVLDLTLYMNIDYWSASLHLNYACLEGNKERTFKKKTDTFLYGEPY